MIIIRGAAANVIREARCTNCWPEGINEGVLCIPEELPIGDETDIGIDPFVASLIESFKKPVRGYVRQGGAMIELAEVAYNAYGDNRNWVVFSGDPMPRWEDQSAELKMAWRAAAHTVEAALGHVAGEER